MAHAAGLVSIYPPSVTPNCAKPNLKLFPTSVDLPVPHVTIVKQKLISMLAKA